MTSAPAVSQPHVVLIAHYAPWLLNFRAPLLRALRASGARVTVLAPGNYPKVRTELLAMGVDYQSYPLARTAINPQKDIQSFLSLYRILHELQPSHVLTTAIKPNIYGALAARAAGVRQIYTLVTGLGYSFQGKGIKRQLVSDLVGWLYRLAFLNVTKVIFQNPDDRELFISKSIVKADRTALVNGSGVDLEHYRAKPLPRRLPVTFFMMARIITEKGIREYLEAAHHLHTWGVPCDIRLAGPLDENPGTIKLDELEKLIKEGNVSYLGELEDVRDALENCHVFVLPSYREGTPRSTLEALATGRAIVTTDAPGCRETVQQGINGFLVPVGDSLSLALALRDLAFDLERIEAFGKASLTLARKRYDVVLVNNEMLGIMGLTEKGPF